MNKFEQMSAAPSEVPTEKPVDVSKTKPEDLVAGLRAEMGIGAKKEVIPEPPKPEVPKTEVAPNLPPEAEIAPASEVKAEMPAEVAPEKPVEAAAELPAEGEKTSVPEAKAEHENRVDEVKESLEIAEGHFQKLEQDLEQASQSIREVDTMQSGSREKYEAAFKMRNNVEEITFADSTVRVVLEYANTFDNPEGAEKIEAAKKRLEELKAKYTQTMKEMMIVWWNAKGQYEGGKSAELAKDYTEIIKSEISSYRAKQMLASESLDDSGKEYIAGELIKRFMDSGKDEDAVDIATLARENGFYKTMHLDSLNADFVKTLKYKNPQLYEKAKKNLGPNTRPYV